MSTAQATETAPESLATTLQTLLASPTALEAASLPLILSSLNSPTPLIHSLALAILSRTLTSPAPLVPALESLLDSRLSSTQADRTEALVALGAVLQVAPSLGVSLLIGGLRKSLEKAVGIATSPFSSADGEAERVEEKLALVGLLALAAGQSGVRAMVRAAAGEWLESVLETGDARIKAMAGVAVVKLRMGKERPEEGGAAPGAEAPKSRWTLDDLSKLCAELVVAAAPAGASEVSDEAIVLPSLEALAYLSLSPSPAFKHLTTTSFLSSFLSLSPASPPLAYAIASLLHNLTTYPAPPSSADLARLKAFASATPLPTPEDPATTTSRISLLLSIPPTPLPTLRALVLSSPPTRLLASKILLSFLTHPPHRPSLLQAGAHKLLLRVIRTTPFPGSIDGIQALAKVLITTNPALVLDDAAMEDAVRALALPLPGETGLLIKFECLMALTNVASVKEEWADSIAGLVIPFDTTVEFGEGVAEKEGKPLLVAIEELMLSSNTLVRRAATELICNLVSCETGATYFEPTTPSTPTSTEPSSHLHLLVALSSSPDPPTRLAASGALASLSLSPSNAASLFYPRGMEIILALLEEDEELSPEERVGLRARGYEILRLVGKESAGKKGEVRERLGRIVGREKELREQGQEAMRSWGGA